MIVQCISPESVQSLVYFPLPSHLPGAVVTDLTGVDPDRDSQLTFQLQQAMTETPFAVMANSRLITHTRLNYEDMKEHVITLTLTDEGQLRFTKVCMCGGGF